MARSRRKAAPGSAEGLPRPDGAAPLHRLSRDQLSIFLYLALLPGEVAGLVEKLGLSLPGFRRESLGDVQRCDLLADEIRGRPELGGEVVAILGKAFGGLPLAGWRIDGPGAEELGALAESEAALALVLWRLVADPAPEVGEVVRAWLDDLARQTYGPAPGAGGRREAGPAGGAEGEEGMGIPRLPAGPEAAEQRLRKLEALLAAARREVGEERGRAEAARNKEEEVREKLQAQLREARAREAQATGDAARAREAAEAARRELARSEAALAAVRGEDPVAEAHRARARLRELEGRAAALEGRLERARGREEELARELEQARSAPGGSGVPAAPGPRPETPAEIDAEETAWLFPVYTREFYDSLEGWDRRIQRAAFKQAHLLAQDHRHPSLRALPLEGLPGYYRVRVATDVRLLYRRGERQNTVEILSLIDREDLDRYVRQAKTR